MDEFMDRDRTDIEEGLAAEGDVCGQRRVRDALHALDVPAPETLRRAVEREVAAARERRGAGFAAPRRLRARPFALAAGALAALVVALAVVLPGSGDGPTVQEAARVALLPAAAPAPPARDGGRLLEASVEGIAYPTWSTAGWRVVGERTDMLAGREIRTVLYRDRRGGRVGYAIAAGDTLSVDGGRVVERHGARIRVLDVDGAVVVTWQRDGHTCILASREVAPARLVALAAYAT